MVFLYMNFQYPKPPYLVILANSQTFCEVGWVTFILLILQMFHINPCLISQAQKMKKL